MHLIWPMKIATCKAIQTNRFFKFHRSQIILIIPSFLAVQSPGADPVARYRAGFVTCASEVTRMIMGLPDVDENVKFHVMKHLANCCTVDSRRSPAADAIIKQEVANEPIRKLEIPNQPIGSQDIRHEVARSLDMRKELIRDEPLRGHDIRKEQIRSQDIRSDPTRGRDIRIETIRSLDIRNESISSQKIVHEPDRSQEMFVSTTIAKTLQNQIPEARTVGEKRIMYQQLLNRVNRQRPLIAREPRMKPAQYESSSLDQNTDGQILHQMAVRLKNVTSHPTVTTSNHNNNNKDDSFKTTALKTMNNLPDLGTWDNNHDDHSKHVTNSSFKVPPKTSKPEGGLIKPVPQIPEKVLISGGIRFMPATVLVPVQVGYAPVDCNQNHITDEKTDVWRPYV